MERIVILTSQPEPDNRLVELLYMLFAECEIRAVSIRSETLEDALADSTSRRAP